MSKIDQYIHKQSKESPEFEAAFNHERKNTELALRLTELRIAAGLTQNQLAKKIGKPQSTISRIETGEMVPSIEMIDDISKGLGKTFVIEFK